MSEQTPNEQPLQVPRRTTPTWEIELLISGALVFSLFTLRDPLEAYFIGTWPVASELLQPLVLYSYLYAKLVLFVLLITFVVHLAARARWVALVGVHSIYPQGPRWDNLSGGPLAHKLTREAADNMDEAIERADNQASLVFGYGIMAAQLSLMIMVVSLIFFGLVSLLGVFGVSKQVELVLVISFLVLMILPMVIDKYLLPRLAEGTWLRRPTLFLLRISFGISLHRMQQPLNSLITTNFGGKRGAWVLIAVIYSVLGLATFDTYARLDRFQGVRGDALAETERDFGLLPTHYARYRKGSMAASVSPYIDSEIVRGPYLRLSLPYQARQHDALLAERCPTQEIESNEGADAEQRAEAQRAAWQARVTCFGQLFRIQLNGATQPNLEFHRMQGGEGILDGVVTFIDVRGLREGRHTLRLEHLDSSLVKTADDGGQAMPAETKPAHLIEFWR